MASMSSAADAIRAFITPLLTGWRIQFGRWTDSADPSHQFCVIKPAGGLPAALVRRPNFTLSLIGPKGAAASITAEAAESIIEAMRSSSGALVFMQPAEPVFVPTDDGRPVFEIAVSAITN